MFLRPPHTNICAKRAPVKTLILWQPSLRASARFWLRQNREARERSLGTAERKRIKAKIFPQAPNFQHPPLSPSANGAAWSPSSVFNQYLYLAKTRAGAKGTQVHLGLAAARATSHDHNRQAKHGAARHCPKIGYYKAQRGPKPKYGQGVLMIV